MHHREDHLTSNTATLAQKILLNSKLYLRGLPNAPFNPSELNIKTDETPLFLYPHENALELNSNNFSPEKKYHLIVPDGSWSQARKVYKREKELHGIQCVKLPEGKTSEYILRKTHIEDGLSTYEAIASALGILEGKKIEEEMMTMFRVMVARVIKSRTAFHNS
jgi:DTW domain-containing protein YfiP